MSRALIVYGTRYGAAASTAEELARVLRQEGLEVHVVDAEAERVRSVDGFDLIVVGSGIQINRWTRGPRRFLAAFREELASKRVALFVCCGSASDAESKDGGPSPVEVARERYLEEVASSHGLEPVALGLFGGVYNYNKEPWWAKKALEADRPRVEAKYKQVEPGVYDTRDWGAIRAWAREVGERG